MPLLPTSPSDVTRFTRINSTFTPDPVKQSRTFVAPLKTDIGPIVKTELAGRGSVLAVPTWKSPAFRGGRIFLE
jgi:hypothetical protein